MFTLKKYSAPDFSAPEFSACPDARFVPAAADFVVPENFHATTVFPEYFKIDGNWTLVEDSRMDSVVVYRGGKLYATEFRHVKKGDLVCVGRTEDGQEGIYVHTEGFAEEKDAEQAFAFRQNRSRETSMSREYDELYDLLKYEKEHGNVCWVLGPACAFDYDARRMFARLVEEGYVSSLLAGNALATHDLEAAYLKTALGQDIYTRRNIPNGHYHHLDTINAVRKYGSIPAFIENEHIDNGIIYSCVKNNVPFVLVGSIRDDGPLPEVYPNVYQGQDAMRNCVRKATTVICLATTLHSIATGNMTPSFRIVDGAIRQVYFYAVDISEFSVNKLTDRGSLTSRGIVTNVQDFVFNVGRGLDLI